MQGEEECRDGAHEWSAEFLCDHADSGEERDAEEGVDEVGGVGPVDPAGGGEQQGIADRLAEEVDGRVLR